MTPSAPPRNHAKAFESPPWAVVCGLILLAAFARLLPHPPNFTPIGAMALLGGAAFANRRLAIVLPLVAMVLSDLFIEFDRSRLFVYGSIVVIALLGRTLQSHRRSFWRIATASLGASVVFFIVTNVGVWLWSGWYSHTLNELLRCYVMAIPFFGNTVMSDLVFSGVLFGVLAAIESRSAVPATELAVSLPSES